MFEHTQKFIDEYNRIINKISTFTEETTGEEDSFLDLWYLHLATALLQDVGPSATFREQLDKMASILGASII